MFGQLGDRDGRMIHHTCSPEHREGNEDDQYSGLDTDPKERKTKKTHNSVILAECLLLTSWELGLSGEEACAEHGECHTQHERSGW